MRANWPPKGHRKLLLLLLCYISGSESVRRTAEWFCPRGNFARGNKKGVAIKEASFVETLEEEEQQPNRASSQSFSHSSEEQQKPIAPTFSDKNLHAKRAS
uniref:Secreted protein n=1 Tax=Globodera rostochiensis TaxID=31243 RepID=A0A914I5T3_GLORO